MSDSLRGTLETILIVDDDELLSKLLVTVIENANFKVLSADSGPNAIALSERTEGTIDLLLTDWDMPEMSGIALG